MAFPPLNQIAGSHFTVYEAYYSQADASSSGSIGALDAANFLKKSKLSDQQLSQIWTLSDPGGKGYLEKAGFFVAMKLIAMAQNNLDIDSKQLTADIVAPDLGPVPIKPPTEDSSWSIKAADRAKYDKIFDSLQPVNNLLSGDKVRPVLVNSKLAVDVLGRVWDLSDIDKDGYLDRDEFAIAMHLVYRALENEPVPTVLPSVMIPTRKRKPSLPGAVQVLPKLPMPGTSLKSIPQKDEVPSIQQTSSITWVVTAAAKAGYDSMFLKVDTDNDGFVTGADVKDLMVQSQLDNTTLAHIWTLCDNKNMGKLNSEQFSLAMYLIQQKIAGVNPPTELSPEMMPPSQRTANTAAFGLVDGTNSGPHSHAADFSSMKELDLIAQEIEDLKKHKMEEESQRIQREADIRIRQGDVQTLQKELDAISSTLTQLETQKQDAQKRLDELDDKKSNIESNVTDIKEKCDSEQKEISRLQHELQNQSKSIQMQEDEITSLREELSKLRQEESQLEQLVEAGKTQLENLAKSHDVTLSEIAQVKKHLTAGSPSTAVHINGDFSLADDIFSAPMSNNTGILDEFTSSSKPAFAKDPFTNSDPFVGVNDISLSDLDPFQNDDPFKGSDPFEGAHTNAFQNDADPFANAFSNSNKSQVQTGFTSDPFGGGMDPFSGGSDPFASAFGGASNSTSVDPFAPLSTSTHKSKATKSHKANTDLFGSDPFDPNAPKRSESPKPSLPPKQKKPAPPRPAPPRPKAGPSPAPDPFTSGFAEDPFASSDPFSNSDTKDDTNFAQFSPSKFNSEESQLAWALADSTRLERQRWTAKEQESADLALALELSKTNTAESFA